jgi:hypothetical protein
MSSVPPSWTRIEESSEIVISPFTVSVAPLEIITSPSRGPSDAQISLAEMVFVEPSVWGLEETRGIDERLVIISRIVTNNTRRMVATRTARSSMLLLQVVKSHD